MKKTVFVLIVVALVLSGCQNSLSDRPTVTPVPTETQVPTEAPANTPTQAPTDKPTATPTTAPTETPKLANTPTQVPTSTPTLEPAEPELGDEIVSGWRELTQEFHISGDRQDVANVDHAGKDRVTISWFWAAGGAIPPEEACTVHVTTALMGERVTYKGAQRTWQWTGDGQPTFKDVHELVNYWLIILEDEPRGGCASEGAYSVSWQNSAFDPGTLGGRPTAAGPYTGGTVTEWVELQDRFHQTDGNTQTWSLNHEGDQNRLSIVWFWAHVATDPIPATGLTAIAYTGSGSIEVTAAGASRTWTWTGSVPPTEAQVKAKVDEWTAVLEKEAGGKAYTVVTKSK